MKRLIVIIMTIILVGCGSKEKVEKNIKSLTEGEKQALILVNRVVNEEPNIITIKDGLILNSLIVELYGKGALEEGTKENLELIGLARLLKASGVNKTDGFEEAFKKEIKLAKSLKIPELHVYIMDNYLVSEYKNIKIKSKVYKDENGSFQLIGDLEYYYDDKPVIITNEQEKLAKEFLNYSTAINSYMEGKQGNIYLAKDENGNTIALRKEESINGDIIKQTIYNYLGKKYIEAEYTKNWFPLKIKINDLLGENIVDYKWLQDKGTVFKFYKNGNKIIELDGDSIIKSFDQDGNIKGRIDLKTCSLDEIDGNYKIQGRSLDDMTHLTAVVEISDLLKIKDLKDVYINLIEGLRVITEYKDDKIIKKEIWQGNKKNGDSKEWYLNGKLKSMKKYFYGDLIDNSKEYYENGAIKEIVTYNSRNGYNLANIEEYHKNGKIKKYYSCLIKNEKRIYDGKIREYYENGMKKQESTYITHPPKFDVAIKDGFWYYYDSNGKMKKEEKYEYGKLRIINEYQNDKLIKVIEVFSDGDKHVKEYKHRGNNREYISKEYYLDQNNNFIFEYKEYEYGKNGDIYLKLKGNYRNGLKEGRWEKYDIRGRIIEDITYVNGKDINEMINEIEEQEQWNTPRVEYYPSGRVKSYSDGPIYSTYEDKAIDFKELEKFVKNIEKDVEDYLKTKDEEIGCSISTNLNEGIGSDISIYLLNKNLTPEEKNKLQELQNRIRKCHEKASQIWGAQ